MDGRRQSEERGRQFEPSAQFIEPGPGYFDRRYQDRARRRAIVTLEHQGYRAVPEPAA